MKTEISLPQIVLFDDYHEISYLEYYLKTLNKKIKIKEIGSNGRKYIAVIYSGSQKDKENAEAFKLARSGGR